VVAHLAVAGPTSLTALARALGDRRVANAVRTLTARNVVAVEEQLRAPAAKARFERLLELMRPLDPDALAALERRAPRQRALYDRIARAPERIVEIRGLDRAERAAAAALVRRGALTSIHRERYRDGLGPERPAAPPPVLTPAQRAAVDAIAAHPGFRV